MYTYDSECIYTNNSWIKMLLYNNAVMVLHQSAFGTSTTLGALWNSFIYGCGYVMKGCSLDTILKCTSSDEPLQHWVTAMDSLIHCIGSQ